MTTTAAVRTFFSCQRFAVVGASADAAKYGHKVFAWYLSHSLPVTPINPNTKTPINVEGKEYYPVQNLSQLVKELAKGPMDSAENNAAEEKDGEISSERSGAGAENANTKGQGNKNKGDIPQGQLRKAAETTAVSIITPPHVTLKVLQEARELGIPAVWMQPGAWDDEVVKFARQEGAFKAVVAGDGGRGHEGWCVLVDGDAGLRAAGKL